MTTAPPNDDSYIPVKLANVRQGGHFSATGQSVAIYVPDTRRRRSAPTAASADKALIKAKLESNYKAMAAEAELKVLRRQRDQLLSSLAQQQTSFPSFPSPPQATPWSMPEPMPQPVPQPVPQPQRYPQPVPEPQRYPGPSPSPPPPHMLPPPIYEPPHHIPHYLPLPEPEPMPPPHGGHPHPYV